MGLAQKELRTIRVAGAPYRWTVSPAGQARTGTVVVVVEAVEEKGRRLTVRVPCRNFWLDLPDTVANEAYKPITPRLVGRLIRSAVRLGWRPEDRRTPCSFVYGEGGRLAVANERPSR